MHLFSGSWDSKADLRIAIVELECIQFRSRAYFHKGWAVVSRRNRRSCDSDNPCTVECTFFVGMLVKRLSGVIVSWMIGWWIYSNHGRLYTLRTVENVMIWGWKYDDLKLRVQYCLFYLTLVSKQQYSLWLIHILWQTELKQREIYKRAEYLLLCFVIGERWTGGRRAFFFLSVTLHLISVFFVRFLNSSSCWLQANSILQTRRRRIRKETNDKKTGVDHDALSVWKKKVKMICAAPSR